jgi:hypothetical protein
VNLVVSQASWFDYYKYEDDNWRDFTISNASTIGILGTALKADLDSYTGILYSAQMTLDPANPNCGCFKYAADGSALKATSTGGTASGAVSTAPVNTNGSSGGARGADFLKGSLSIILGACILSASAVF